MPGYEVLGFTGSWESTDALHCRAMGVGDRGMLYVWSVPLQDIARTRRTRTRRRPRSSTTARPG